MKKVLCILSFALSTAWGSFASADNGLGLILGSPTGFSGRIGVGSNNSIDFGIAHFRDSYSGLYLHGTYLRDRAHLLQPSGSRSPIEVYYGLGFRFIDIDSGRYEDDVALGPRASIGLLYNFYNPNLEIFGELSATIDIIPRTDVDLDGGIGIRIRF